MLSLNIVLPLLVALCWGAEAAPVEQNAQLAEELLVQQQIMNELNTMDPAVKKEVERVFSELKPEDFEGIAMNLMNELQNLSEQQQQQLNQQLNENVAKATKN